MASADGPVPAEGTEIGAGIAAGPANSLLFPSDDNGFELLVAPAIFEPVVPVTREQLEDLQIRSALAAFRCHHRDQVTITALDYLNEADRAVTYGHTTRHAELTALPTTPPGHGCTALSTPLDGCRPRS